MTKITMRMKTRSMIGQMMVTSEANFITWGNCRGMVAECSTYTDAEQALADDRNGCKSQGGYSDARIYQDDGNGHWELAQ